MAEGELWGEMLMVLKDISNYLAKDDSIQEKAKIDKPPKISEYQEEMTGGPAPSGKPGAGVAQKGYVDMPDVQDEDATALESSEKTMLEKAEKDSKDDEDEDEGDDESSDDVEELKSLLKDIRSALLSKSGDSSEISKIVSGEIKKQLPNTMDRMLRKMGYTMSRPDVVRLGVEDGILKKSSDDEGKITSLTSEQQIEQMAKTVDDLSKKSWSELGRLRDSAGDFKLFPR